MKSVNLFIVIMLIVGCLSIGLSIASIIISNKRKDNFLKHCGVGTWSPTGLSPSDGTPCPSCTKCSPPHDYISGKHCKHNQNAVCKK